PVSPQRFTGANSLHQQNCRAGSEQDVRLRHDPVRGEGYRIMKQNHFTLSFPLKSPSASKLLAEQLPPLMPELYRANDTIGTVHYSSFTVLSENTRLFLGYLDAKFALLMAGLAQTPDH